MQLYRRDKVRARLDLVREGEMRNPFTCQMCLPSSHLRVAFLRPNTLPLIPFANATANNK